MSSRSTVGTDGFSALDALIALALAGLLALAVVGYRVFATPRPEITRVTPLVERAPPRLRVEGRHLQPFLRSYVNKTVEPFVSAFPLADSDPRLIPLINWTSTMLELQLPELATGTYDLYVYDEFQQVAMRRAAFSLAPPEYRRGWGEAIVRFFLSDDSAKLLTTGDRDLAVPSGTTAPQTESAIVTAVRIKAEQTDQFVMRASETPRAGTMRLERRATVFAVDVTLRVPLVMVAPNHWQYKEQWLRAGEPFSLETSRFRMQGQVIWVSEVRPLS